MMTCREPTWKMDFGIMTHTLRTLTPRIREGCEMPACLHGLLACLFWQQEAVLLSSSHVSQPCHYLRNCRGFWEPVWGHNHPPVKGDQDAAKEKYTSVPRNAQKACMSGYACYTQVCAHVRDGLLPNIMALSTPSNVAVCINTSGQYNFTHRHLQTPTFSGPPFPP